MIIIEFLIETEGTVFTKFNKNRDVDLLLWCLLQSRVFQMLKPYFYHMTVGCREYLEEGVTRNVFQSFLSYFVANFS